MTKLSPVSLTAIVYLSSINSLCLARTNCMYEQGSFTASQSYKVTPPILS
jgi:hypothetical protein